MKNKRRVIIWVCLDHMKAWGLEDEVELVRGIYKCAVCGKFTSYVFIGYDIPAVLFKNT